MAYRYKRSGGGVMLVASEVKVIGRPRRCKLDGVCHLEVSAIQVVLPQALN